MQKTDNKTVFYPYNKINKTNHENKNLQILFFYFSFYFYLFRTFQWAGN